MKTAHQIIRERLLAAKGLLPELPRLSLAALERSEWSTDFERLQRNRLIMGALRYGLMGDSRKPNWDRIPDMVRRLRLYQQTGNLEALVDVANLCLLEFVEGKHPHRHFAADDDGQHAKPL